MAWPDRRPSLHRRPLIHRNSTSSIRPPLGHRNSASSIHGHPKRDSIDAEIARRDATAAAQYAYARAEERKSMSSTDFGFSNAGGLSRANSTATHSVVTVRRSDSNKFVEHGGVPPGSGGGLKRQQSVRFAGPNAIPRRQSLVRLQSQDQARNRPFSHARGRAGGSASALRPRALTVEGTVPAEFRPPSRSSSIGKSSIGRSKAIVKGDIEGFVEALEQSAVYDEYYAITAEDDVASTPSSYRRIRRSKSMFSPGKTKSIMSTAKDRGSIQYSNGTPSPGGLRKSQSFYNRGAAGLRFQKSMSFLRGGRERQRTSSSKEDHDIAVAMARDKFLHQVEQQRLREQPSFLFRANKRREEHSAKPFRRSVRSGSGNSTHFGKSVSSDDHQFSSKDEEMKTLKGKARKVSKSFRNKIKGFFKRGSTDTEEGIPDQQVTAHETHVSKVDPYPSAFSDVSHSHGTPYDDIPCPTPNKIYSVASRVGSLHAIPSTQQLRSRTGSVQSLRSDASSNCSKSRVTSWTSTNDTVTSANSRHAALERERQRLSIIQENGTHVSSSSFARPPLRNQFSAYPLIERSDKQQFQGNITQPVDSQRVYSALMKRLDENSPHKTAGKQVQRQTSLDSLDVPRRTSSMGSRHGEKAKGTPATIRAVPPSAAASTASLTNDGANDMELKRGQVNECDDVFSPAKEDQTGIAAHNDIDAHRRKANGSVSSQSTLVLKKPTYGAFPPREPGDDARFYTPQQIADRMEGGRSASLKGSKSSKVLRESKSTFFPHSGSKIQRANSPYRRALAATDYKPDWKSDYTPPKVGGNRPTVEAVSPTRVKRPESAGKLAEDAAPRNSEQTAYSESIYSRTTGEEATDFDYEERSNRRGSGSGTAVLLDREVYRPTHRPGPFEPSHRLASSAGSMEWKKWMSAEVAALERIKEPETAMRISYALPSMPRAVYGPGTSASSSARSSIGGHVREKAQIDDDDLAVCQGKIGGQKQPLGILQSMSYELKAPPMPMMVSKPKSILKKSTSQASLETVFCTRDVELKVPTMQRIPLRQSQSRTSMRSVSSVGTARIKGAVSSATLRTVVDGGEVVGGGANKLVKKSMIVARKESYKNLSSSLNTGPSPGGLGIAVEKQFGPRSVSLSGVVLVDENVNPTTVQTVQTVPTVKAFQAQVQGLMGVGRDDGEGGREWEWAVASKRMVDLFLSSRRRRVGGDGE